MTARLWAILHVVSYILIFVLQDALKINAYNPWDCWRLVDGPDGDLLHYTMGIWNILTKTLAIYTTGIAKDLTETRTVSHGDQLCSRWTGWRHGQYPKGVCYMADGPDGRRAVSQGGLLYGSMDRTEAMTVPQGGLLYGRWTGLRKPTDIFYMHMVIGPDELTTEWGIIPLGV